ncbi:LAME_0D00650g1_1 [Lachancea meyersii CBS 8951]|uniref:LAME_0D00650g1_1 n=1 Tax=Lachancea meyersii CBS 8951 TaxID=1266667 RepID=A0A1G4J5Y3_9SACH|nr:LAME_0D00650g1_1 [Lachancea meyersii CBS 8951]
MTEPPDSQDSKRSLFHEIAGEGAGKRKKLACVECRQQKSKCDAHEKAPGPCTRCLKKNIPCVLQKDFRRTYKRFRNEAIEQRFKELTKTLGNLDAEEILRKIESEQELLLNQTNFTKSKLKKLRQDHDSPLEKLNGTSADPDLASQNQHLHSCTPKSLGEIYMSEQDISEVYSEFVARYHPFLPVVDISKGPERIYRLSPCLFWVIMLIGLRRKFKATGIMTKLSNLVKSILAEITMSPIIRYAPAESDEPVLNVASVYSVQAFLLYTFWPPLTSSLSADTSWNTMGSAMFQAIRVGLNCAEFSTEYATTNSEQIQEQVKTWICCNIVSQTIASSFGFPAFVSFDHTVISACKTSLQSSANSKSIEVSESIKQMMYIAHFEYQLTRTMNSNPLNVMGMVDGEEKLPLLRVLEQQLGELEIRLRESKLDDIRKFLLLVAKVHLLTYIFTGVIPLESLAETNSLEVTVRDTEINFEAKRGYVKVYNAAIELLMHTTSMCKSDPHIIKYFPGVFVLNIWQTACIISKLSHSSLNSVLNLEKGKKMYQEAVTLTNDASVLKYDMAYRSSGIMKSIWKMFSNMHDQWESEQPETSDTSETLTQSTKDFNLDITIKSRMSASVFFDCLYKLRERCGMAKLKRELRSGSEENELEDGVSTYDGSHKGEKRVSYHESTEDNARKLIKTIPLDPEPINAPATGSNSPNLSSAEPSDVVSLKSILNKRVGLFPSRIPFGTGVSREPLVGTLDFTPDPDIDGRLFETTQKNSRNTPGAQETATVSSSNRSDSPVPLDRWDNWESDSVWKDVDILMNEFAFNPTV